MVAHDMLDGGSTSTRLRRATTEAILRATVAELADSGFSATRIDTIARRAGVGKAAIYRRWSGKEALTASAVAAGEWGHQPEVDTGSLAGDVRATLDAFADLLVDPQTRRIIPDMIAESERHPALAEAMRDLVEKPRRRHARAFLERAVHRGELPVAIDLELALDIVPSTLYWRLSVRHLGDLNAAQRTRTLDDMTRVTLAALQAA